MEAHLIDNHNLKIDIIETVSYLTNQGYHVKSYHIS